MWQKIKPQENVPLAQWTTFKIGGPARWFFVAKSKEELQAALSEARQNDIPTFILGGGSNILVAGKGFNGLVIKIQNSKFKIQNSKIIVAAGEKLADILAQCQEHGLGGLEFTAGVPATLGGAIWANFGAFDQEIGQLIDWVEILDEEQKIKKITQKDCQFSYRDSIFKREDYIILEAQLQLKEEKIEVIRNKIEENLKKRKKIYPSAGSVFKNPPGEKTAGELIESLGLKGLQIGGAKISEEHANYIVNTGKATAEDVIMLISLIKQKVRDNLGVQLQEEIKYVGL